MRVRTYELMYIIDPTIGGDEQYEAVTERVRGYITNAGGTLAEYEVAGPAGRRRLAYPIRHNGQDLQEGFYVLLQFTAQPQAISVIERDLKLTEEVFRYLLTIVEQPAAVEQA